MFGDIWPIRNWASLGAIIGCLFQFVQIIQSPPQSFSYNSGRLIGGLVLGAIVGALVAMIRNTLAGAKSP